MALIQTPMAHYRQACTPSNCIASQNEQPKPHIRRAHAALSVACTVQPSLHVQSLSWHAMQGSQDADLVVDVSSFTASRQGPQQQAPKAPAQPLVPARLQQLRKEASAEGQAPASPLTFALAAGSPAPSRALDAAKSSAAAHGRHAASSSATAQGRPAAGSKNRVLEPARDVSPPAQQGNEPSEADCQPKARLRLPPAPRQPPAVPKQSMNLAASADLDKQTAAFVRPEAADHEPAGSVPTAAAEQQQPRKPVLKRLRKCAHLLSWVFAVLACSKLPPRHSLTLLLAAHCPSQILAQTAARCTVQHNLYGATLMVESHTSSCMMQMANCCSPF